MFVRPERARDLSRIEAELAATPDVEILTVTTQDEALIEFGQLFADSPEVTAKATAVILPPSVTVVVADRAVRDDVIARVESDDSVYDIVTGKRLRTRAADRMGAIAHLIADELHAIGASGRSEVGTAALGLENGFRDLARHASFERLDAMAPAIETVPSFASQSCGLELPEGD